MSQSQLKAERKAAKAKGRMRLEALSKKYEKHEEFIAFTASMLVAKNQGQDLNILYSEPDDEVTIVTGPFRLIMSEEKIERKDWVAPKAETPEELLSEAVVYADGDHDFENFVRACRDYVKDHPGTIPSGTRQGDGSIRLVCGPHRYVARQRVH